MSNNEEIVSKAAGDSCQLNDEIAKEEPKAKSQTPKSNSTPVEVTKPAVNEEGDSAISKLEQEIQKRTHERDNYKKKLEETEGKLKAAESVQMNGDGDNITLRKEMEDLRNSLTQTHIQLNERSKTIVNQDCQISALHKQVISLKEVVAITKDLLNIRNMEVQHLQKDVDIMESRIKEERDRHKLMINKMDDAVRINADLKKEYQTQLRLFQDLKGKYEEKVDLLTKENRAIEAPVQEAH